MRWTTSNLVADYKYPVSDNLELFIEGGKSWMSIDSFHDIFNVKTIVSDPYGNVIATYGQTSAQRRYDRLEGYNLGLGMRWYFK